MCVCVCVCVCVCSHLYTISAYKHQHKHQHTIAASRFVRVNNGIWHLAISQLLVYARGDTATNKARGKAVTGSAAATRGAYQNITDGNEGDRPSHQGLLIDGANQWAQVKLSSTTDIQRVVVIMPSNGFDDVPITGNYTLELLDASGQHTTYTCDFTKATRSDTNNGTYTFDFDAIIAALAAAAAAAAAVAARTAAVK